MQDNQEMDRYPACPYWLAGMLDNPLRRWMHKPEQIFAGLVREGQTALDLGCGPGYFTMGLARLIGPTGRVIAVDMQPEMLGMARAKAEKAGLLPRIRFYQNPAARIALDEPVDFALAFWMFHEVREQETFLKEVRRLIKPDGYFLLVEPVIHITEKQFKESVELGRTVGLKPVSDRKIRLSRAVLFQ